jgi:type II secretory pathway component GspD/PulD (secretin)
MYFNKTSIKGTLKLFILILLIFFLSQALYAKKIEMLEFYDQPITDILLALAGIGGVSIVPDDTVHGNASFVFVDIEFEDGLRIFLNTYNMYLKIEDGIYHVSKIRVDYNAALDVVTAFDAEDVTLLLLVEALAKAINKTILKDPLPTLTLSIHQKNIKVEDLLKIFLVQAPQYKLGVYPSYYHIQMLPTPTPSKEEAMPTPGKGQFFQREGNLYNIQQERKRFKELVEDLFRMEGAEYQLLFQRDVLIDSWLRFYNKTFEEMLGIICEQGNADFKKVNGIYYIFEIAQRDILKKLKETMVLPLRYITAQDLQRLLPPDLGSSKFYRIDTGSNVIILNGSAGEIIPIADFIKDLDQPMTSTSYYRYDLKFIKAANFQALLPDDYKFLKIVQIPDSNAVVIPLTSQRKKILDDYVNLLDQPLPSSEIHLKYIKAEDLVKNLPPSAKKEDILETQDPSIVFLKGPPEKQEEFRRELAIIDQPAPQIVYHILAISYSESEAMDWQQSDNPFVISDSSTLNSVVAGNISGLLSINFDIPTILGYHLAANLNFSLSTTDTEVLTDTTLYALSGEKVSFNDTEVFRYSVGVTDTTTGGEDQTVAGPTESYNTGFTLSIEGWASGDGMITMGVEVSISSQKDAANVETGDLGTTFEKSINTKSRTSSGKPIKIGGLIRENMETNIKKIPLLGDIPLLGILFQSKKEKKSRSEIVVYILPHIMMSQEEKADTGRRLKRIYEKYLKAPGEGI